MALLSTSNSDKRAKVLKSILPPLAFGGKTSPLTQSPFEMGNNLKTLIPGLKNYDSLDKSNDFLGQSCMVNINGLICAAAASSPSQFNFHCNDACLIIPMHGSAQISNFENKFSYQAGSKAVLVSNSEFNVTSDTRSVLIIKLDEDRLTQTAQLMLGFNEDTPMLRGSNIREINLHLGDISFDAIFKQFSSLIDQFYMYPKLLNKTGVDDGIYSAIAMMLYPAMTSKTFNLLTDIRYERRLLDHTCEYIKANLTSPITLAMLDKVSNMSRRKLHYAFQDRFGSSPMQWVRNERLILARHLINNTLPWQTVTAIALECGFTKMSTFSQFYKNRYGELPSIALAKSKFK